MGGAGLKRCNKFRGFSTDFARQKKHRIIIDFSRG
jgi:hypothetical protein